jgi:CRP/FNR family cyclic AMP-dependent transcriptional regulator
VTPRAKAPDSAQLLEALRHSELFGGGEAAGLERLVQNASPVAYPAGAFLMRQGEPAAHVYVLTAGEVAIISPARGGAEQVHSIVGPGELIGELALLSDGKRTAGARATSPTLAWLIGREAFWAFLEVTPSASAALLRLVAARLRDREALIDDLLSLDVKGRLAKALLGLAERHGHAAEDGSLVILVRLTHRDLAGLVGASRENVTRALAAFRKRGLIAYDTNAIRLLDPEALRRLVFS